MTSFYLIEVKCVIILKFQFCFVEFQRVLWSIRSNAVQVDLTGQLQMERESDSETLSATMANTLKVSETRGSTADQEEDRFYDCDDTLPEEDTSTAGQTNVQCNETAQSDRLESDAGIEKDNDSDRLGNTYSINHSCLSTTSAENTLDSSDSDSGLKEQNNEDQEKSERFVDDDEMRDGDSDSELKEAASSDKVTEFDEEYLRELEKDLTDEEKEVRIALFLLGLPLPCFMQLYITLLIFVPITEQKKGELRAEREGKHPV